LRAVYERDPAFAPVLAALLAHRSSLRKPGDGWVLNSFWSAWEAFATGSSYRDTIVRAGGLAGIRWGLDESSSGIPAEWLGPLRGREIVEGLLRNVPTG
jgi:hypothetical protein